MVNDTHKVLKDTVVDENAFQHLIIGNYLHKNMTILSYFTRNYFVIISTLKVSLETFLIQTEYVFFSRRL